MKQKTRKAKMIFLVFYFCISSLSFANPFEKTVPPNIIVFLVDDMGLMDTSVPFIIDAKGNPVKYPLNDFYQTPQMEKLAKQGVRFTNFYAHTVCSPSRISIMTGQSSARHRTTNPIRPDKNNKGAYGPSEWNWKGLTKKDVTLARVLQQNGYKTIHVGKAHFGPFKSEGANPLNLGFDVNIAGSAIGRPGSYLSKNGYGNLKGNKSRAVPGLEKYYGKDIFLTEALTLEANLEISKAKKEGKPFYLYMSHYAVHAPFHSDKRFAKHYENSGMPEKLQDFATLVEGVDKSLGDIIQHVKDLNLGENTLIFFLGDNGSASPVHAEDHYGSSAPLKGKKGNKWEGGMRVPFIASWVTPDKDAPNQQKTPIASNTIQQQLGSIFDLFPTICQIAGIENPKNHTLDGFPLQKQLKGEQNSTRNEIFLDHFPHKHHSSYFTSLVKSDWKVIYQYALKGNPKYELYNLKDDPFEKNDLSDKNPEKLKEMMEILAQELKNADALYPEKDGKPLLPIIPKSEKQLMTNKIIN